MIIKCKCNCGGYFYIYGGEELGGGCKIKLSAVCSTCDTILPGLFEVQPKTLDEMYDCINEFNIKTLKRNKMEESNPCNNCNFFGKCELPFIKCSTGEPWACFIQKEEKNMYELQEQEKAKTKITYENEHGIFSIERNENYSMMEGVVDDLIVPLLLALGFSNETIKDYITTSVI